MNKNILRQVLVILSTLAMLAVNWLSTALPLNNNTPEEISDRFDVYFVPAGYVFSIWGLIYLLLIGYSIFQALPAQRQNSALQNIGYLYLGSAVANITWIFLWHYEFIQLSLIAMLALLGCLVAIYLRLGIGKIMVPTAEKWLVHVTFSVYLGWITVATIANTTVLLDYLKWGGWGVSPVIWTLIIFLVVTVISGIMSFSRADIAFTLVLIWAFIGIAVKHQDVQIIAAGAYVLALCMGLLLVVGYVLKPKSN